MVDNKIKKLVALLEKMPKTDRGYSWELRDAYGNEAIRAYGANAAAFKFILDHTDELIAALSEAEKREREARAKALEDAAAIVDAVSHEGLHNSMWRCRFERVAAAIRALQSEER